MDMLVFCLLSVILSNELERVRGQEMCSIPEARKCLMERRLQYDSAYEQKATSSDSFKTLCFTQVRPDDLGDCFKKWTELCPNEEARDIRLEWEDLNKNITVLCQGVCPNILDVNDCKNMTNTNELKEEKFESFCRTFNGSMQCAQEVLSDCQFGFPMFSELLEPKIKEYWRYICHSGCTNIDETVAVIIGCAPKLKADPNCIGHANFKKCVLESPIVCETVMALVKYKYRKYDRVERLCRTTTTQSTTPSTTSVSITSTTSQTDADTISTTQFYTQLESSTQKDMTTELLTLDVDICLSQNDLDTFEMASTLEMEKVLLVLKFESCLHNLTDDVELLRNTKAALSPNFQTFYHKAKQNAWSAVLDALSGCKKSPEGQSNGCSGHMYGLIPCSSASTSHCVLRTFLLVGVFLGLVV